MYYFKALFYEIVPVIVRVHYHPSANWHPSELINL